MEVNKKINESAMLCRCILLILAMTLIEGAVRKWVGPVFGAPLLVIRDVSGFFSIVYCARILSAHGGRHLFDLCVYFVLIVVSYALIQAIFLGGVVNKFIGVRFWVMYPAVFVFSSFCIDWNDYWRVVDLMLWAAVLMLPLAIFQHLSPISSFINKQIDGDESKVFKVALDVVRVTGTFSFTAGYSMFVALIIPVCLDRLFLLKDFKYFSFSRISILCVIGLVLVSGSRALFAHALICGVVFLIGGFFYASSAKEKRGILIGVFCAVIGIVIFDYFVPTAFESMLDRVNDTSENEDTGQRLWTFFLGEPGSYVDLGLLGFGLGSASNLGGYEATGGFGFTYSETEVARTLQEGGILGIIYIFLKIMLIFFGFRRAIFILRCYGDTVIMVYWVSMSIALWTWSMIGQLTANVFVPMTVFLFLFRLRFRSM